MSSFLDDQAKCSRCGHTPINAIDNGVYYRYQCEGCGYTTYRHSDLVKIQSQCSKPRQGEAVSKHVEFTGPFSKKKNHSRYVVLCNKDGEVLLCCDADEEWAIDKIVEALNKEPSNE